MIATHSTEMIGRRPDSGDGTLSPCSPARDGQLGFVSHPFNLVLDKLTNTNSNQMQIHLGRNTNTNPNKTLDQLILVLYSHRQRLLSTLYTFFHPSRTFDLWRPLRFHVSGQSSLSACLRPHMSRLSLYISSELGFIQTQANHSIV